MESDGDDADGRFWLASSQGTRLLKKEWVSECGSSSFFFVFLALSSVLLGTKSDQKALYRGRRVGKPFESTTSPPGAPCDPRCGPPQGKAQGCAPLPISGQRVQHDRERHKNESEREIRMYEGER